MAHGERASRYSNCCGKDYWKPVGLFKSRLKGWMYPVSYRARVNKRTKRITHHSQRQEIRRLLDNKKDVF